MFKERLEFEYRGLMWFYKARLGRWFDYNHCMYTVNFLSRFWVAFLSTRRRSCGSAGGGGQRGRGPGLASVPWVTLNRPDLGIQRDEVAQSEFSDAGWLPGPCFLVVPGIATVGNRAVSMMPVPLSFFSIVRPPPSLCPPAWRWEAKRKKIWKSVGLQSLRVREAAVRRVFYTDHQIWKQRMWKAGKIHLSPPPQDPNDREILKDTVVASFQLKWGQLLRKAEDAVARADPSLASCLRQEVGGGERGFSRL